MSSEQRSRLAIENRVANWRSYGVRSPVALGMPEIRQLETTSLCNLRCVFCPYEQMTRSKHNMDLEVFTEFLNRDELSHVSEIALHHFGEPFLQANFAQYVSVATKLGIDTVVSSNLNTFSQDQCFEVLRAGLTRIIVSIDAVRPETYRALRLRGNLDKVEQNLRMLARIKQMVGSNWFIQAQFISTPENEKEAAEFERRWASVEGIDQVVIRRERSHAGQVKRHDQYEVREEERLPCRYLWESVVVLQDGTVVPCCKDFDGKAPLGNIGTESMESIWNGDAIKRLRKAHAVGEWSSIDLCGNCSEWRGLAEFPPEEAEGLAEAVRAEKSQFRTEQVHLRVWE